LAKAARAALACGVFRHPDLHTSPLFVLARSDFQSLMFNSLRWQSHFHTLQLREQIALSFHAPKSVEAEVFDSDFIFAAQHRPEPTPTAR
jgi:hypothetical protein